VSFSPRSPREEEVTFEITNDGNMTHDFSIEDLEISTGAIRPGRVRTGPSRCDQP